MDFSKILNQVLNAASNSNALGGNTAHTISKAGGGAAAIGILSMILGRNGGASLTKLGSLAALGSLAYQAYQQYQQKQNAQTGPLDESQFNQAQQSDNAGKAMLSAMIAAAAADGVINDQEKQAILNEAGNDPELQQWLAQAINSPATPAEIAALVGQDQALAAQVYLAARMVCQDLDRKEIIFLANLATALNLEQSFVEQLEKQAGF